MNKKTLIIIFIILALISVFLYFFIFKQTEEINKTEEKEEIIEIPARPQSVDEGLKSFNQAYKLAQISTFYYNNYNAKEATKKAIAVWQDFTDEFLNGPDSDYTNIDKWDEKLEQVFLLSKEAKDLQDQNQMKKASQKLDEARKIITLITTNKEDYKLDNELFFLFIQIKKASDSNDVEETKKILQEIKLDFTIVKDLLKEKNSSPEILSLEKAIAQMELASQTTLTKYQSGLIPAFLKVYEKY